MFGTIVMIDAVCRGVLAAETVAPMPLGGADLFAAGECCWH